MHRRSRYSRCRAPDQLLLPVRASRDTVERTSQHDIVGQKCGQKTVELLKRDFEYKSISVRSVSSPAGKPRRVFHCRTPTAARNPQSKRTPTRMPRFQFFESSCLNVLQPVRDGSKPLFCHKTLFYFVFRLVGFVLAFWRFGKIHEIAWSRLSAACSCACYLPVPEVAGFAFCQRVQTDDKDSPVNFTFYREPVLSCCLQGAPVVGLQFTG